MKQLIAMAAVTLILAACTSTGQPVAQVSTTPAATGEPTGKGGPSATPPTTLVLRVVVVPFSCRIPVSISAHAGGFITFPQAEVTLAGKSGGYYDAAFSRWLTVPRAAVAPDGRHYATVELGDGGGFVVHVVDYLYTAADGLQKVSNQPGMPANGCL